MEENKILKRLRVAHPKKIRRAPLVSINEFHSLYASNVVPHTRHFPKLEYRSQNTYFVQQVIIDRFCIII